MAETLTVYASIGNSDDKLSQADWHHFHAVFNAAVRHHATRIYGDWVSPSADRWQNARLAFEITADSATALRTELAALAAEFHQDSIAWAVADTDFIGAQGRA